MPSFIEHVEEYLGPIQGGGRLSDGVQAAWFADCPVPGASTFMTLGLSHHAFHQTEGGNVRPELLIACHAKTVEAFNPASVLANVCAMCVPAHHAPPRGTVFGPRGRFFPDSEMTALYCSPPTCFHEGLPTFDGFPEPFLPIWLVPITSNEARFIHENGWPAFESLLEEADPDLLDLSRPSIVARPEDRALKGLHRVGVIRERCPIKIDCGGGSATRAPPLRRAARTSPPPRAPPPASLRAPRA